MKKENAVVESHSAHKCSICKIKLDNPFFCKDCNDFVNSYDLDYFSIYNFPKSYDISLDSLEEKYLNYLALIHPDKFIGDDNKKRIYAHQCSSLANEAYLILKNSRKRAEYLLSLSGVFVNTDHDTIKPEFSLLEYVFDLRQELDEVTNYIDLKKIQNRITHEIQEEQKFIWQKFKDNQLPDVAQSLIKIRYLEKIIDESKIKKEAL